MKYGCSRYYCSDIVPAVSSCCGIHSYGFRVTGTHCILVHHTCCIHAVCGTHPPPWGLLLADDLALCAESSVEMEEELEKWRKLLEENELKISREKTKYLRPRNGQDQIYICVKKSITNSRFIQLVWAQPYKQEEDARKMWPIG